MTAPKKKNKQVPKKIKGWTGQAGASNIPRYKLFQSALNRRERLLVAKYGPIAATWEPNANLAFDYVLQVAEDKPLLIGADELKKELFEVLRASLKEGDGKVFRDIAQAVEVISAANKGAVHNRTAYELLISQKPPKDVSGNPLMFDRDLSKTADEVLKAANKEPTEANRRTLRRLQEIFDIELKRKNSPVKKNRKRR